MRGPLCLPRDAIVTFTDAEDVARLEAAIRFHEEGHRGAVGSLTTLHDGASVANCGARGTAVAGSPRVSFHAPVP